MTVMASKLLALALASGLALLGGYELLTRYAVAGPSGASGQLQRFLEATLADDSTTLAHFTVTPTVGAWVDRFKRDDRATLEAWATGPLLAGSAADGLVSRATLRRLTWRSKCPMLSTLSATLVQQQDRPWTVSIQEIRTNCPER